ncbi:MAG TPA: hypothetical protein PLK77_09395 [Pyrinomonadaceae bacterium]|nr:hypothetical protein [Pyrinomonadaceae bacterium]
MAEEEVVETTEPAPKSNAMTKWLIGIGLLLLAFLLGFVPIWLSNRQLSTDLANRDKELRRAKIQNALTAATIYARRGEYETARQNTSTFFTDVRSEMDKGNDGILTEQERIGLSRVMAERDEIITLLSRNDPAAAERLSNAFIEYVGVVPGK